MVLLELPAADLKKYRRLPRQKETKPDEGKHVLLISAQQPPKNYIAEAIDLLEGDCRSIVLKGLGSACGKVVAIAEIIKRRVPGVYQITKVEGETTVETYELKEEHQDCGLESTIQVPHPTPGLHICLSLDAMDKGAPGYQDPLPETEVQAEDKARRESRSAAHASAGRAPGRGRSKGGGGAKGGGSSPRGGRGGGVGRGGGGSGGGRRRYDDYEDESSRRGKGGKGYSQGDRKGKGKGKGRY
eukprot:Hpha_TRINITY_DN34095_c0_g1::TRINITY_DN34095_c0_g1_i1::g.30582::m.30582